MASTLDFQKGAYIAVGILFVLIAGLIIALLMKPVEPYSDDPQDWIQSEVGASSIDIEAASDGFTRYDGGKQIVPISTDEVGGIFIWGSYDGILFSDEYYDLEGNVLMRVNPGDIRPNDGIPEAFATLQLDDPFDKPVSQFESPRPDVLAVYLFVDEDWKNLATRNNIVWGDNIDDLDSMNEREFDYNNYAEGIYYDQINTSVDWVMQTTGESTGRLIFGDISMKKFEAEH